VRSVVVHDVPRPNDPETLVLTTSAVELDDALRAYFQRKVLESLSARGLAITADQEQSAIVRDGVRSILDDPGQLVDASRAMAEHLYELQGQSNSPGLLSVITGEADGAAVVAVLKLEREQGVHVLVDEGEDGQVINLEFLRDLMLTRKTRVFKAAVLDLSDAEDSMSLRGTASDDQRSRDEGHGIARFFLREFLGCKLAVSAEKSTEDFWNGIQTFIREDVESPERQGRYQVAVQAYLEEQEQDFQPETFVGRHIAEEDQPRARQRLRDGGLEPREVFGKDIALISRKIDRLRVAFAHGMVLTMSPSDVEEERVRFPHQNGEGARTLVEDAIARFGGR
jgi:hypothetical protein